MKKNLLAAAVVALTLTMSSCKKDYTCECTQTGTGYMNGTAVNFTPETTSDNTGKMKEKDAKEDCEKRSNTITVGDTQNGGVTRTECKIK